MNRKEFNELMSRLHHLAHTSGGTEGLYWSGTMTQLREMRQIALGQFFGGGWICEKCAQGLCGPSLVEHQYWRKGICKCCKRERDVTPVDDFSAREYDWR